MRYVYSIHSVKGIKILSSSHYVFLKCTYSTLAYWVHPMLQEKKYSMEGISNNWPLISFNRVPLESKTCIKRHIRTSSSSVSASASVISHQSSVIINQHKSMCIVQLCNDFNQKEHLSLSIYIGINLKI